MSISLNKRTSCGSGWDRADDVFLRKASQRDTKGTHPCVGPSSWIPIPELRKTCANGRLARAVFSPYPDASPWHPKTKFAVVFRQICLIRIYRHISSQAERRQLSSPVA